MIDEYRPDTLALAMRRSSLIRPAYAANSAWHEHVPFAFWIVEALRPECIVELGSHYAVSYFAFCQAVETCSLDTRCYAIDTWKGDEHSGLYEEDVFRAVSAYNNAHYSRFSRLVRSTFDDAAPHFLDGQIDLLHIDGHHTYEAVANDFHTWLPKLSSRGVVLFHDTNVRERGFGVFRLFEELKATYKHFEFMHGHGLGIVAVGSDCSPPLKELFELQTRPSDRRAFTEYFALLGRASIDAFLSSTREKSMATQQKTLELRADEVEALKRTLATSRKDLEGMSTLLAEQDKSLEALGQKMHDKELEATRIRKELEETQRSLATEKIRSAQVDEMMREIARLKSELDARTQAQSAQSEQHQHEVTSLNKNISERFSEIAVLTQIIKENGRAADVVEKIRRAAALEIGKFVASVDAQRYPLPTVLRSWSARIRTKRLNRSHLFDASWYRNTYEDVRKSGIDPARHYVEHGAREGREPNSALEMASKNL